MQLGVNLPGPFFVSGHLPGTGGRYRARHSYGLLTWLLVAPLLVTVDVSFWLIKLVVLSMAWVALALVAAVALAAGR